MKKDATYFRALSEKIDELYFCGKNKEGEAELKNAFAEADGVNEAYRLFFEGELAGYIEKDSQKQEQLFRKALEVEPEDFFLLRNLGFVVGNQDRYDEAEQLFDKALENNPNDFISLRTKGIAISKQGKWEEANRLYNQALNINPRDYRSLCQIGVELSKQGKEEEAIKFFNLALEINPNDFRSIGQKGVVLFKQNKIEDAIKYYEQALAINPKDYHSLRNKGVAISKQGKEKEAIKLYEQALEIKPNDARTLREWSVVAFNSDNNDTAWEKISKAYALKPDEALIRDSFYYLAKYFKKDIKSKKVTQSDTPSESDKADEIIDLRVVVDSVRRQMGPKVADFLKIMKTSQERTDDFLKPETNLKADCTFFLVLRKWNSYTPIIPATGEERYVGGGYFLFHNGRGVVVDPGYNFIENFFKAVGRVHDIHDIVLTHAHNDHTMDFESLLSLVYQYNKGKKERDANYKKIRVFANMGSLIKFSGLLDLRGAPYLERVIALEQGHRHDLDDGLTLNVLLAYHDETITTKYSVGLEFVLEKDGGPARNIVLTSDTGLFPQKKQDGGDKIVADTKQPEIWTKYKLSRTPADLLITHLGSIREEEFTTSIDSKEEEIYYPNHLGILGVARVITALRPRLALVSEFGEELKNIRENLMDMLYDIVREFFSDEKEKPNVMPADLPFIYDMGTDEVYCVFKGKMISANKIVARLISGETFYYRAGDIKDADAMGEKAKAFEKQRENDRSLPYFAIKS